MRIGRLFRPLQVFEFDWERGNLVERRFPGQQHACALTE